MTDVIDFQDAAFDREWREAEDACPVLERQEDGKIEAFTTNVVECLRNDPAMKAEAARVMNEVDDFNIGMAAARATVAWLRDNTEHSYRLDYTILPEAMKAAHEPTHPLFDLCDGYLSGLSIELANSTGHRFPSF